MNAVDVDADTAFVSAMYNGHARVVEFFLDKGFLVQETAYSSLRKKGGSYSSPPKASLLHVVVHRAPMETVQLLLDHGADPRAKDDNDAMPFHSACSGGRIEVIALLSNVSSPAE